MRAGARRDHPARRTTCLVGKTGSGPITLVGPMVAELLDLPHVPG